jgi:AraC-like DNA-binding protein
MTKYSGFKRNTLQAVGAFKELLDDHCANGDCAQQVSARFGVNRNVLQKAFKKQYGITIRDYKLRLRMERSRQLLEAGKDIKEISLTLHYTTPRAFSFAFKKHYGLTPTAYSDSLG